MRVQLVDVKLFYDVEGAKLLRPDGPRMREFSTMLLLHGGPGGDHALFKPAYGELADVAPPRQLARASLPRFLTLGLGFEKPHRA